VKDGVGADGGPRTPHVGTCAPCGGSATLAARLTVRCQACAPGARGTVCPATANTGSAASIRAASAVRAIQRARSDPATSRAQRIGEGKVAAAVAWDQSLDDLCARRERRGRRRGRSPCGWGEAAVYKAGMNAARPCHRRRPPASGGRTESRTTRGHARDERRPGTGDRGRVRSGHRHPTRVGPQPAPAPHRRALRRTAWSQPRPGFTACGAEITRAFLRDRAAPLTVDFALSLPRSAHHRALERSRSESEPFSASDRRRRRWLCHLPTRTSRSQAAPASGPRTAPSL
jgi:hypothetical protein